MKETSSATSAVVALFAILLLQSATSLQTLSAPPKQCGLFAENGLYAPTGLPALTGSTFHVPELRLRFDPSDGGFRDLTSVDIFYMWEWFDDTASDGTGEWIGAGDIVECQGIAGHYLTIPAYTVKPKSWSTGKGSRKLPRFDHIEISFLTNKCGTPRITMSKREIGKFKERIALVKFACGGLPKFEFVKK